MDTMRVCDEDELERISLGLKKTPLLRMFRLVRSGIDAKGCEILSRSLKELKQLNHLDLSYNKLNDKDILSSIMEIISSCPLQNLLLADTGMTDIGAKAMAQKLKNNITMMDVSSNPLEEGVGILLKAFVDAHDIEDEDERQQEESDVKLIFLASGCHGSTNLVKTLSYINDIVKKKEMSLHVELYGCGDQLKDLGKKEQFSFELLF